MNTTSFKFLASCLVAAVLGTPVSGMARTIRIHPDGYQVTPSQNSPGTASFIATVDRYTQTIKYKLVWNNLKGNILQSHIHFGGRATEGDIVLFLCTNLGNTPPTASPAPVCGDATSGMVTGTLHAGDIVAGEFAGITPGDQLLPFADFKELANAINAGATFVIVHTKAQPNGELRAQIPRRGWRWQ